MHLKRLMYRGRKESNAYLVYGSELRHQIKLFQKLGNIVNTASE